MRNLDHSRIPAARLFATGLLLASTGSTLAEAHYVDLNSTNATPPYTNWTTAATNIQDAVDAAVALGMCSSLGPAATFSDANWISIGGLPGADGTVRAAVVDGSGNLSIYSSHRGTCLGVLLLVTATMFAVTAVISAAGVIRVRLAGGEAQHQAQAKGDQQHFHLHLDLVLIGVVSLFLFSAVNPDSAPAASLAVAGTQLCASSIIADRACSVLNPTRRRRTMPSASMRT